MTDLKARFRDLDALGDPDVWEHVGSVRSPSGFKSRRPEPKRWAVAVFAMVVAGAAIGFVAQAFLTTRPAGVGSWVTYEEPGKLWHLSYPASWHVQPFGEDQGTFRGVLISNVDFVFRHPDPKGYGTTAWDMLGLPGNAVVLEIQLGDFGPVTYGPPWSHFPLSLAKAQRVTDEPAFGAPQPRLFLPLNVRHQPHNYSVFVWFGHQASSADKQAASRIVASLRFPIPRAVLHPAQGPVGSTVRVTGRGFLGDWREIALHGGFGVTLLGKGAYGCDATIRAQFEALTGAKLHVDGRGHLTGSFTVPDVGHCTAQQPGSAANPRVRAGPYTVLVGCYACDLTEFRVTKG